jgi:UDP-2,4-diacetamido-2,4,6-trideoxy-beta-L-altropyranose hydrolase
MNIAIRADASAAIGLGHVKRCLALAEALRERGASVAFFWRTIDADCAALITALGFASHAFASAPVDNEDDDADAFLAASRTFAPQVVLADHYGLGAPWHQAVRRGSGARLAAIDDLGDRPMAVDLLVDHNFAVDHRAKHRHLPADTRLLGGPPFALLSPGYANAARHQLSETVRSIGIFMGGADEVNLSELVLAVVREQPAFGGLVEIATTSVNPNLVRLRRAAESRPGTRITLDQRDLATFFARHDLHLGAGGGATWERCCIGAPTLAMLAAPNQRQVLLPLQQLGVVRVVAADPPTPSDIAPALHELIADAALRRALSTRAQALVDGRGASRVAHHLLTP